MTFVTWWTVGLALFLLSVQPPVAHAAKSFIYHHHIHKCGGFAFMACVRNTFDLCGGRDKGQWECSSYPKRHIPEDYASIASGKVDFVSAEEGWNNDWTRGVDPALIPPSGAARPRIATMLREPSSRVISNFLYNVVQNGHRLPEEKRNANILDNVRSTKASGANFMSRRTLPMSLYGLLAGSPGAESGEFPPSLRIKIQEHLENAFEFVGIMEEYDLSVCLWLTQFAPEKVAQHCPADRKYPGVPICPKLNGLSEETRRNPRVSSLQWACPPILCVTVEQYKPTTTMCQIVTVLYLFCLLHSESILGNHHRRRKS